MRLRGHTAVGLNALALSNLSFLTTDAPGVQIGVITGKTAGSALTYFPNDGHLAFATGPDQLVVGLVAAGVSATSYALTETIGAQQRVTFVTITCAAPNLGVVDVGPGAGWTGTPGSGYGGSPPTDPTRTTAKPALLMQTAWGQTFGSDLIVGVDSEAVGGVQKVICHCEGNNFNVFESVLADFDVNGKTRQRVGYWVRLKASLFQAISSTGGIDLYFEAVPNDNTMQHRVIGPTIPIFNPNSTGALNFMGCGRFYPRGTSATVAAGADPNVYADKVYKVAASGAGGAYQTWAAALAAAQTDATAAGASGWAANIHFIESGTYEADDITAFATLTYNQGKGFWVVDCATGVSVTISRSTYRVADDFSSRWQVGPVGMCFRGAGITIDLKNISSISPPFALTCSDGFVHPMLFSGCKTTNTTTPSTGGTDPLESWYWHKRTRYQGVSGEGAFWEDSTIEYLNTAGTSQVFFNRNNVHHTIYGVGGNTQYFAQNYYSNTNQNYFFQTEPQATLSYTGAGTGTIYETGGFQVIGGSVMHLAVNGSDVATFPLGAIETDTYFNWSAIKAYIDANLPSWHMTLVASPVTGLTDNQATVSWNPNNDLNQSFQTITSTPTNINCYHDFHQDYWHDVCNENVINRGNQVIGDVYALSGGAGLTAFRLTSPANDMMFLDNSFYVAPSSTRNHTSFSHLYHRGNAYAQGGWSPDEGGGATNTWDAYCSFEDNIMEFEAGGVHSGALMQLPGTPPLKNNHVTTFDATVSSGINVHSPNTGNVVETFADAGARLTGAVALYVDAANGNIKPVNAGTLAADLKARGGTYDAFGNARVLIGAGGDIPGPWSKTVTAPTRPF